MIPLLILLFFGCLVELSAPSRIIVLTPFGSKSHKNVFDPLIDALAHKGHDLVVISPFKSTKVPSKVREILTQDTGLVGANAFEARKGGILGVFSIMNISSFSETCEKLYKLEEVQALIQSRDEFDLIISNAYTSHCAYGIVWKLQEEREGGTPHIIVTTTPAPAIFSNLLGNRLPSSFVPEPFFSFGDRMNFLERTANFLGAHLLPGFFHWFAAPLVEKVYQKFVPGAELVAEIEKKTSMIFMNSHFSMTSPRPLLPNVIEVGGMHCRPGKPLPAELDSFLSSAPNGFILFSLGSIVKPQNMPEPIRKAFLNVFGRLKGKGIRVLWKWDTEEMSGVPDNVKLVKWVPQQDVLAHKNIKMFITHGGLLSSQESVYHGVPQIAFPFFGDQDMNSRQAEKKGYSLTLEILELTEEKLENAISEILNNPKYSEQSKSLSRVYRDQPTTPLETAVYWTEYLIRHKGAKHLQSAAKDLSILQYHCVDVVAFLLSVTFLIVWLLKIILWDMLALKVLFPMIRSNKQKGQKLKGKND